jgi:hypothetical protein
MPLRDYHLAKKFDADINIQRRFEGEVPEFECREAAVFVHVSWRQWTNDMDGWERACAVAHYRTALSLKSHVEDAAEKASKRHQARQARRKNRSR